MIPATFPGGSAQMQIIRRRTGRRDTRPLVPHLPKTGCTQDWAQRRSHSPVSIEYQAILLNQVHKDGIQAVASLFAPVSALSWLRCCFLGV